MASSPNFPLVPSGGRFAGRRLARTLKALRLKGGLKPAEMAARLGIARRSYEHFEAGGGRPNLERIGVFADVTNSDPFAIVTSLAIRSPEFAVRCAENKLMLIMTALLLDFDARVGDDIARLEPATIISVLTRAFDQLALEARRRDAFLRDWLAQRAARTEEPKTPDESEESEESEQPEEPGEPEDRERPANPEEPEDGEEPKPD